MVEAFIHAHPLIFFGGWFLIGYIASLVITWSEGSTSFGGTVMIVMFWPFGVAIAIFAGICWLLFNGPHELVAARKQAKKREREDECQA